MLCIVSVLGMRAQEDITSTYLTNADLSTENSGWTYYSDDYKYQAWRTTNDENVVPGVEFYAGWGSLEHTNFKFSQTVTLPAGDYRIAVNAFFREGNDGNGTNANKAWIFAGDTKQNVYGLNAGALNSYSGSDDMNKALAAFKAGAFSNAFDFTLETEKSIELGFQGKFDAIRQWCILGPVKLYKYSLDDYLTDYDAKYAEAEALDGKPMNADVQSALTTAMVDRNTFSLSSEVTAAIATLTAAINAAQVSVDAYAKLTPVITKIDAALAAATSATASTESYDAIKTAYTNGTIANGDIQTNIINAYNAVIPVIKSQTAASADFTLAIQNPSFEYGDFTGWTTSETSDDTTIRENSNATYTTSDVDGNYLFNTWSKGVALTQTVSGLPTGQYTLKALVASDGGTIYLLANGDHNTGTLTSDKTVGVGAEFTFLVKDGNATIGTVGGDGDGNYIAEGHWWYKADNFRLIKNRELTAEEEAILPTAIALKNGEDVVSDPIALDATTNTVTLTPSYTPAEATPGYITWETSDATVATVADGVVTAVSSGTATITATSTLAPSVSASVTVTVSFPETEVAEYVNDGATRTVHNYGENLIKNGSFEYPDGYTAWTIADGSAMSSSSFTLQNESGDHSIKANGHTGADGNRSISTGWPIESGKTYVFGYKVKSTSAGNSEFHVVSLTNALRTETQQLNTSDDRKAIAVGTSWTDVKYEFTNTDGYAYVQFRARWLNSAVSFDDFYLVEKNGDDNVIGNVQYALDAIPTSNIGTGAFQYSQDAIDAANALVQGTATVEDVTNAYTALATLNAPADGKLYNIVNITDGFTHANKALTFKSASDADLDANSTAMAWETAPGSYLPQGVKFTAVDGTLNGYKLSYTRADGNVIYISTGSLSGLGSDNNQIRPTNNPEKALTFVVTSVGDNHWYLYNTLAEKNVGSNGDTGFYTAGGSNKDVKIQEAVNNEVTLNIAAENQYGTLILPFNADVPSGVTAYSVSEATGNTLTLETKSTFVANTPYIVYAESGVNETLSGLGAAYTDATYTAGLLTGVYAATTATAGTYVLQNNDDLVGFYQVEAGEEPTVGANRAYLTAPTAGVKAFFFDDVTAIKNVFDGVAAGNIYDLNGRKVSKMQKGGVYVVNGKKILVK